MMSMLEKLMMDLMENARSMKDGQAFVKLQKGLYLAYTHGETVRRLVASRRQEFPSDAEDKVIRATIEAALLRMDWNEVVVSGVTMESMTLKTGWGSSVFTWQAMGVAAFWELGEWEKKNGLLWLNERAALTAAGKLARHGSVA